MKLIRKFALALALVGAPAASRATAQSASGLVTDATVLPSRAVRLGAFTSFNRWDTLLGDGGKQNIAAGFADNAVGTKDFPFLAPSEADIQAASSNSNFHLNLGRLVATANSRIFTMPLIAEYGLTSKLTLGVSIPIVETRTTLVAALNPKTGFANVGANPALSGGGAAARAQNAALVASLRAASDTLQRRVTLCQTTPTNPICSPINGQQTATQALIQSTTAFASALEKLYGTDGTTHPGDAYVPIASDPAAIAVANHIIALNTQYQTFVNRSLLSGSVANAQAPIARDQLQALLATFGHDSIQVADRSGIGDISVGATYQLANTFGDTTATASWRYRLAVNGTFRIGTGEPANRNRFYDNGTGYGQHGIVGSIAADFARSQRYSASVVGSYTKQLGTIDVNRVPNAADNVFPIGGATAGTYSAGDVLALALIPRVRLSGYFSFNGFYSMLHTAADSYVLTPPSGETVIAPVAPYGFASSTAQQLGFGFSYSTIASGERGPGSLPFEVSFNHLETIAASGGPAAKSIVDRVEMKIFFLR